MITPELLKKKKKKISFLKKGLENNRTFIRSFQSLLVCTELHLKFSSDSEMREAKKHETTSSQLIHVLSVYFTSHVRYTYQKARWLLGIVAKLFCQCYEKKH